MHLLKAMSYDVSAYRGLKLSPSKLPVQQHWRTLTRAFKTSCYRLDPQAKKRDLLSSVMSFSHDDLTFSSLVTWPGFVCLIHALVAAVYASLISAARPL